ncbi:arylamine N-acetyltransferase family protein [Ciceribacter thiooxidans]|uniref:Arylamine N-acetyltransferase n=1 Tax=Ciceribacter thiooxidans TaxID=1969821 RepID=A0ABV7I9C5_9HYPH|nr:arylamine N-acetyltransferase [Ciceribacter thiooxidans]
MTFDKDTYLARIGLAGADIRPDAEGLARLQAAQIGTIPFENIEVLLGTVPDLDPVAIWRKTVAGGRGGYCLELNRLFGDALAVFGFEAAPVLGRVRMGAPSGGPRAHHAFVVTIDGREWLADTGFGGPGPRLPVDLSTEAPQTIAGERFRVVRDAASGEHVLQRLNGETWFALYGFDRVSVAPADYLAANVVCARWKESPFPQHLMMTVGRDDGRLSLFNRDVRHVRDGGMEERTLASEAELAELLVASFGLRVDASTVARVWAKIG